MIGSFRNREIELRHAEMIPQPSLEGKVVVARGWRGEVGISMFVYRLTTSPPHHLTTSPPRNLSLTIRSRIHNISASPALCAGRPYFGRRGNVHPTRKSDSLIGRDAWRPFKFRI